jgi:hypothetical protein
MGRPSTAGALDVGASRWRKKHVEQKTPIVGTFAFHPLNGYDTYPIFRVDEHPSIASIL